MKGRGEGTILFCPIIASIDQTCVEFVHILETDFALVIHTSKKEQKNFCQAMNSSFFSIWFEKCGHLAGAFGR